MEDFSLFDAYRKMYTRSRNESDFCSVDHLLRIWKENKSKYLMPLFGDKLILEKSIEYNKETSELRHEMRQQVIQTEYDNIHRLLHSMEEEFGHDLYDYDPDWSVETKVKMTIYRYIQSFLNSASDLVSNSLSMDDIEYFLDEDCRPLRRCVLTFSTSDAKIAIQNGMKMTRLIGQIAAAVGATDAWEQIRLAHSRVLNQKKLKGTLCLSIHPLDYATASDNDNGWSSCMSWKDDGCYRMGTVEMMNSPMVICAYLRSDKQALTINDAEWNSKKWRAWIVVNKDVVLCNRHYPYHNDAFAETAVNWVREMVANKYGWTYDANQQDLFTYFDEHPKLAIDLHTKFMYNDLGGTDIVGAITTDHAHMSHDICFSGPAECMICGDIVDYDEDCNADRLECHQCYAECYCYRCGTALDEDDIFTDPDGNYLCRDCFDEQCYVCEECGETCWSDDRPSFSFPMYYPQAHAHLATLPSTVQARFRNWKGEIEIPPYYDASVNLCESCLDKSDTKLVRYADLHTGYPKPYYEYDRIVVPNPKRMSMERALQLVDVPGSGSLSTRFTSPLSKGIREFYEEQWEYFRSVMATLDQD